MKKNSTQFFTDTYTVFSEFWMEHPYFVYAGKVLYRFSGALAADLCPTNIWRDNMIKPICKKPSLFGKAIYLYNAAIDSAFWRTISHTSGGEVTCTSVPNCMIQLTRPSDTAASKCVSK